MFDKNKHRAKSNQSRRKVLKGLASVGTVATVGTSVASAKEPGSDERILTTFDPDNPEEVRKAFRQLISLPNRREAEKAVRKLSEAQKTALKNFVEDTEVVTVVEGPDGTQHQLSADESTGGAGSTESLVSVNSVEDETITAVSQLKSQVGTVEATFRHSVYWEYDGTNVLNESHWKEVGTGVAYNFDGLSTNYIDNRGDEAVSRMVADFSSCLGGPCVTKSLGTEIWMFEKGGWTVNEL